jgi:hypothetical protein
METFPEKKGSGQEQLESKVYENLLKEFFNKELGKK